jgi:predicted RNA-binding Zn-ribbon protein involved in translation (DUF1610 family)
MAQHRFACETCYYEIFTDDSKTPHVCPNCNAQMYWDLGNTIVSGGTYKKKIVSEAMAISAGQADEHRRLFPGVELTPKDGSLCPTFTDFKTHEDYLKKTGFVKHPQKSHNTRRTYT